jgi:diadenosine tetraphosphate (Ap4A) HIT family hydrolase
MNPEATSHRKTKEDCPFCAIARGEDPSVDIVCEGKSWVAFFPTDPATPGHTLVIPRAHFPDLWSLDARLGADLTAAVIRVGRAINGALAPEGMNLITSSGEVAEQTVFHLHLHIVPRWRRDGFGNIWPPEKPMKEQLKEDLADLIRQACDGSTLD